MSAIAIPNIAAIEKLKALVISIVSPESEAEARGHLTDVRLASKRLVADIKALKQPYQDGIKAIDDASKPWKDILAERDQSLETAILAYQRKVRLATEEANRKALERYEAKVERVEAKAIEQGKPIPLILPPAMIVSPQKSVQTDGAKQTVVKRKAWRVRLAGSEVCSPEALTAQSSEGFKTGIPLDYFILDTARIGKVIRAGGSISGIEVFDEESISIRA